MNIGTLPFFGRNGKAIIGGCDVGFALNSNSLHMDEAKEILVALADRKGQKALWKDRPGSQTYLKRVSFRNEKIFDGKSYGIFHSDLYMLSLFCARTSATLKEYDQSLAFLDRAHAHYKEYSRIMEISMQGIPQEPHYVSPLLSEAKGVLASFVVCKPEYLTCLVDSYPAKLRKQVMKDPKYADLFQA